MPPYNDISKTNITVRGDSGYYFVLQGSTPVAQIHRRAENRAKYRWEARWNDHGGNEIISNAPTLKQVVQHVLSALDSQEVK